jgi:hypothetical protein
MVRRVILISFLRRLLAKAVLVLRQVVAKRDLPANPRQVTPLQGHDLTKHMMKVAVIW